jgi:hypothetical protein
MAARILVAVQPLPVHPDFTPAMLLAVRADEVREAMVLCEQTLRNTAAQFSVNGWEVDDAFANAGSDERFSFVRPGRGIAMIVGKLRITRGS